VKAYALAALLALAAGAGKKKPAPAPHPTTDALIRKALDSSQDKVQACVLDGAPQGKWTMTVKLKLTLDSAGQIMGADVKVTPDAPKTASCIEGVIRGLSFPKSIAGPLTNVDREWSFSSS
jgi:hypothetical protein